MKTISFVAQKGGTGKTTSCQTVAVGLSRKGYKVLAVDADPQGSLTSVFGREPEDGQKTLYDIMRPSGKTKKTKISETIVFAGIHLDLVPGDLYLSRADADLASENGREFLLKDALEEVSSKYDVCLIDAPPSLGIMTYCSLVASDYCVIPLTPDYFSAKETIESVRKPRCNPGLEIAGILLTKFDRTSLAKIMQSQFEESVKDMGTVVFRSTIRNGVVVRQSQVMQSNLFDEAPRSAVTNDYTEFINELEERCLKSGNKQK